MSEFLKNSEVSSCPLHVIALTETWLDESIPADSIQLRNFSIYRCDRNQHVSNKSKGGGILIAVDKSFSTSVKFKYNEEYEQLDISIKKNNFFLYVSLVYFPPDANTEMYTKYVSKLLTNLDKSNCDDFLIMGDYNIPGYNWAELNKNNNKLVGYHQSHVIRESANAIFNLFESLNCKQNNTFINNCGNTLDLFLTKSKDYIKVYESLDPLSVIDVYHSAHIIELEFKVFENLVPKKKYYNYYKGNYPIISSNIMETNWSQINTNCSNVNDFLSTFNELLKKNIETHIPESEANFRKFPEFFSDELKQKVLKKRKYHYFSKTENDKKFQEVFNNLRKECKILHDRDYNKMINDIEIQKDKNPKKFWKFVNGAKKKITIKNEMYLNDITKNNEAEIANLFASHFKSVYSKQNLPTYNITAEPAEVLDEITISKKEIINVINELKTNTSAGPDSIHPQIIKMCSKELLEPLYILFNKAIKEGIFPNEWKNAFIIAVYKSGDVCNVKNFRPISIINTISKIFEKILFLKLSPHLQKIIISKQHGGMPHKSTITNLCTFNEYIAQAFSENCNVFVIYLDVSKAFDMVNHKLLISKLQQYGITGKVLSLIESYLTN